MIAIIEVKQSDAVDLDGYIAFIEEVIFKEI